MSRLSKAQRGLLIRRVAAQRRPRQVPDALTVHARFQFNHWHARCDDVTVNHCRDLTTVVYAAAQEAWEKLLGDVSLDRIEIERTDDATVFVSRVREEGRMAA